MPGSSSSQADRIAVIVPALRVSPGLLSAVDSILSLDAPHVDIVVSVNTSDASEVAKAEALWPRLPIQIISPGQLLPHAQHWDFAVSRTSSEWVTILTDRCTLRRCWAERIAQIAPHVDIIAYKSMAVMKHGKDYFVQLPWFSESVRDCEPEPLLPSCRRMQFPANAPYLLNAVIRRTAIDQIRAQLGKICGDLVGDCGFFSSVMACNLSWTLIDEPLIVMHSAESGVGASLVTGTRTPAADSLIASIGQHAGLFLAPIPEIVTNMNIRAHEFVSAFRKAARESEATIDPASYCASINSELSAQSETIPADSMNRLASFARSNRATLGPRRDPFAKSVRRRVRNLLERIPPGALGPIGRRLNLPAARFASLDAALQYAANIELFPNSLSVESALWQ